MLTTSVRRALIISAIPLLLLLPLLGMQFSDEVNWTKSDFLIMGLLLSALGLGIELVCSRVKQQRKRILLIAVVALVFFLVWAELAVGIFGSALAGS